MKKNPFSIRLYSQYFRPRINSLKFRNIVLLFLAIILVQSCATSDPIFVLSPSQSMLIIGKGKGQDAAINPYSNSNSIAIVKNMGQNEFFVRIQKDGEVIENRTVLPYEKQEIQLLQGSELYLDTNLPSKAQVKFKNQE